MTAAWEEALAHLRRDLDALDGALASGAAVVDLPWRPPDDLGPLPATLRSHAEELLDRLAHATELARARARDTRTAPEERRAVAASYHGISRETEGDRTA